MDDLSPYPNRLSYFITQFGILTIGRVFYANFFYELFGTIKDKIKIINLFEPERDLAYLDISKFPTPPDSMVQYVYQLKLSILIKTIVLMVTLGGMTNFFS